MKHWLADMLWALVKDRVLREISARFHAEYGAQMEAEKARNLRRYAGSNR